MVTPELKSVQALESEGLVILGVLATCYIFSLIYFNKYFMAFNDFNLALALILFAGFSIFAQKYFNLTNERTKLTHM